MPAPLRAPEAGDTKDRLMDAGEVLFARHGIDATRIRQLNELAGQRNSSALHYHFGSRGRLVTAILLRHQAEIDAEMETGLDEVASQGRSGDVRAVLATAVAPMAQRLDTPTGRNWARIVPQVLSRISDNLREDLGRSVTPTSHRILSLLDACLDEVPEPVRRERLVTYAVVLTTLLAERAHQMETDAGPTLDTDQFVTFALDVLVAMLCAPTTVRVRSDPA